MPGNVALHGKKILQVCLNQEFSVIESTLDPPNRPDVIMILTVGKVKSQRSLCGDRNRDCAVTKVECGATGQRI